MKERIRRLLRALKARNLTILYYPPFQDPNDFTDHYYRMVWYLHPIANRITKIVFLHIDQPLPLQKMPDYLDPAISLLESAFAGKLCFLGARDKVPLEQAEAADLIFLWHGHVSAPDCNPLSQLEVAIRRRKVWHIDQQTQQHAGSFYLYATAGIGSQKREIAESRQKFQRLLKYPFKKCGYVFGTGPNLQLAMDHDFSQGTAIACNSMVKNTQLMEKLKPPVIAVGDPIFHAGCSSYAGEFRRHLLDSMNAYDSYLVVPMRDYRVYMKNLPKKHQDRIIGIPFVKRDTPNLDLKRQFSVTTTSNIMTLLLLPLACTFFETIVMAGFDGRPIDENSYFWKHDPNSQIPEHMNAIQRAHPSFFAINYDQYYLEHIATVESWLRAGENENCKFVNLTPSFIPALEKRFYDEGSD